MNLTNVVVFVGFLVPYICLSNPPGPGTVPVVGTQGDLQGPLNPNDDALPAPPATPYQTDQNRTATNNAIPSVRDSSRALGKTMNSGDAVQDNAPLQQAATNQALNKAALEEQIRKDLKSGKITPKLARERRQAFGIASEIGFMQGMMEGQAQQSGAGRRSGGQGSGPSVGAGPSASPGSPPVDFSAATSRDENVMGGLKTRSGRRPSDSPAAGEIADTSSLGAGGLTSAPRANGVQVFLNGTDSSAPRNDLGFDEDRAANDQAGAENPENLVGGVTNPSGVAAGVVPGGESKPSALDELETALSAKRLLELEKLKRANAKKNDRSPASQAGAVDGVGSGESASGASESVAGVETAAPTRESSNWGLENFLFGESEVADARELAASRSLIRSLVSRIDSTSNELTGYKLALWFVIFFFVGFASVTGIRSHRSKKASSQRKHP
jgi:hypothetical protein